MHGVIFLKLETKGKLAILGYMSVQIYKGNKFLKKSQVARARARARARVTFQEPVLGRGLNKEEVEERRGEMK